MVVHHAGDAVPHGALVAPARRDGSGIRLWEATRTPNVGSPWHHPSVPGGPSTATILTVGASWDPGELHSWRSTGQAVKTQAPDSRHACWGEAGHRPSVHGGRAFLCR